MAQSRLNARQRRLGVVIVEAILNRCRSLTPHQHPSIIHPIASMKQLLLTSHHYTTKITTTTNIIKHTLNTPT